MNGEILYLVSHTEDCQGYNKHSAFTSKEDAEKEFKRLVDKVKKDDIIKEVYDEGEWEFYFEHGEGHARIYIDTIMQGKPCGHIAYHDADGITVHVWD